MLLQGVPVSDAGERAAQLAEAAFEFMEEIRPKARVLDSAPVSNGPPYVHRVGATHGPAFSMRRLLPSWEPPLPRFGTWVAPVRPFPVKAETQEIPEAFRRR